MWKKQAQNIVIMVVFLAILFIPLLYADWEGGEKSEEEKRVLALAPWKRTEYPGFRLSMEEWINDNAGFRTQAMQAKINAEYHLFGVSAVPNNLIGQDHWVYYAPPIVLADYTGDNLWDEDRLEQMNLYLSALNNLSETNGAKMLMTILPDKKTIYPEYYSPYIYHETVKTRTDQVARSIRSVQQFPLIVMDDVFQQKKDLGFLYSPRLDSGHWNSLGAYVGYEALMEEASKLVDNVTYIPLAQSDVQEDEETGAFFNAVPIKELGYQVTNERTYHQVLRPEHMDQYPFMTYNQQPDAYKIYYENVKDEKLPRILYIGDSYGIRIHSYLSQSASSLMYVHLTDMPNLHRIMENEKFDLVIFEMAERMFDLFMLDLEELYTNMYADL